MSAPNRKARSNSMRHDTATTMKPTAQRHSEQWAVDRQPERANVLVRFVGVGCIQHERGIRYDGNGAIRDLLKPKLRELVAHGNAVQQLADHARAGAAFRVIERPDPETETDDLALERAKRQQSRRPVRHLDAAVIVLEQPPAPDDDQILPAGRRKQRGKGAGTRRDYVSETRKVTSAAPARDDRYRNLRVGLSETRTYGGQNSRVSQVAIGVASEKQDLCHKLRARCERIARASIANARTRHSRGIEEVRGASHFLQGRAQRDLIVLDTGFEYALSAPPASNAVATT